MSKPIEEWNHREFAEDLADAKSNTLVEVPLGGVYKNNNRLPRADVVEVKPSYNNFYITIYEVKRERSDFLSSIRSGKWKQYLPHCHRFYFAARKGIASQSEVPDGVGLALRNENGWYSVRAGEIRKDHELPRETLLAYLFQRVKFMNKLDRREKIASHYRFRKELKSIGEDVQEALDFYNSFGWAINKALENGLSRSDIMDNIRESISIEEKAVEAIEFKRVYGYLIEGIEEETGSHYYLKNKLRKILTALKRFNKQNKDD